MLSLDLRTKWITLMKLKFMKTSTEMTTKKTTAMTTKTDTATASRITTNIKVMIQTTGITVATVCGETNQMAPITPFTYDTFSLFFKDFI